MAGPVLRPLSLGEILDVAFGLYRSLFIPLLVVTLAAGAIPMALSVYVEASGGVLVSPGLYLLSLVFNAVLGAIAAAACTFIVSESYLGRRLSAGEGFNRAGPFVGRLILLGVATSLVVVMGLLLLIIPGLILVSGLALATPALVLESQPSSTAAMARSWSLTRDYRAKIFSALFVVGLLLYLPFIALGGIAAVTVGAGGPEAGDQAVFLGLTMAAAVLSGLIWPLVYCVLTVAYYDLRVRKEAFDLEVLAAGLAKA